MLAIENVSHPRPWSKTDFEEELDNHVVPSYFWVAAPRDAPSCVAGYLCFRWLMDEVYIINLTVAPRFRRLGAAKELMNLCIRWAKGRKGTRLVLDVNRNNLSAVAFYRAFGFDVACEGGVDLDIPSHDQFVMTLTIGD